MNDSVRNFQNRRKVHVTVTLKGKCEYIRRCNSEQNVLQRTHSQSFEMGWKFIAAIEH